MVAHIVVDVLLSILVLSAIFAVGTPIHKREQDQQELTESDGNARRSL